MQVSQDDLIQIIEKASTVPERLETRFLHNNTPGKEELIRSRMEKWVQTVAGGNKQQFEKRFLWDFLDLNTVHRVIGSLHLGDKEYFPSWAETLKAALEATTISSVEILELEKDILEENRCLAYQETLPFEELFLPFVKIAREKLKKQAGSNYCLLMESAHVTLERRLLHTLTYLCSEALGIKFQVIRNYHPVLISRIRQPEEGYSKKQYKNFIREMQAGGLLAFFQEYSVLARLAATVTDFWVNNNCKFIQRLAFDWTDIQTNFQSQGELGYVVAVQPNLSDRHNKGKTVIALTFASGLKLIYKPRDLGIEATYFQLLAWLNEQEIPLPFKILRVLNRSTHGWVEYVEHLPCPDKQAAKRYYQRAGMLLCLLYALEGTDCHKENIIACGEHPVLIDMEMLLAPRVREVGSEGVDFGSSNLAMQEVVDSVLRIGLLPTWVLGPDGVVYDSSGLGGIEGQETHFRVKRWQQINTDSMVMSYEYAKTTPQANIPSLDGVHLLPGDYVEELVAGFSHMYRFLVARREALLASNGPLKAFAHQQVRFLFRETQVYSALLKEALQPKHLRDGIDYSIALDVLYKPQLKFDIKPHYWQLLELEKQALAQLDIPLFTTRSDSDALAITANKTLDQYFTEPSYNLVVARVQKLNEQDLEKQIGFICGSLYARTSRKIDRSSSLEQNLLNLDKVSLLAQEALVQQAVKLAQEMQMRALLAPDGSATWMGLNYISDAKRFQFEPMSGDLYDGTGGVALFLSALEKVTGGSGFRDLALGALQSFRKLLQNSDPELLLKVTKKNGIGGGKGLGSIIYSLVQIDQFLNEPILLEDAKKAASLITPDAIATDQKFDIIFGAAGAILGLLALHKATDDPEFLEVAIACGHHLLDNRCAGSNGYRAWATVDEKLLTGMSHGAAGIAYSLLRLYAATQNTLFLNAAKEAIAYENSVFSVSAKNWPDFRHEKPGFGISWCHGAPGIGLARLGGLAILNTQEIRQEIETALQNIEKIGLQDIDHLCCGNFGRIEVLLVAARQLSCPELLKSTQQQTAYLVTNALQNGYFQISPNPFKGIYNPAFFSGTAGIGYELLRLAYPDLLPSVLLWEVGNLGSVRR